MEEKIIKPESCDECLFFERTKNEFTGISYFGCRYYPNEKSYPSIKEDKLPFCKVEKIVIYEREE